MSLEGTAKNETIPGSNRMPGPLRISTPDFSQRAQVPASPEFRHGVKKYPFSNSAPPAQKAAKPNVQIIVPMGWDYSPKLFNRSLDALHLWEGCKKTNIEGGGTIYKMRNAGIRCAKQQGCDAVLFIDADMTFEPDALERIVSHDKPIVGGFCRKRRKPFGSVLYRYVEELDQFTLIEAPEGDGLIEVDATGGAFLYVKMEVFDELERQGKPWFINKEIYEEDCIRDEDFMGEDLYFFRQILETDYPVYVDLGLKVGHLAHAIITSEPGTNALRVEIP